MLSWSGLENDTPMDIGQIGEGRAPEQQWGNELHALASAAVHLDDDALARARAALIEVAGVPATIDAAAVAANFEMMTRLADGTGARMPDESIVGGQSIIAATRMTDVTSRR